MTPVREQPNKKAIKKKTARKVTKPKTLLPAQPSGPEVVSVPVPDNSWTRDRLIAKIAVDGTFATVQTVMTYAHGYMGEHGSMQQTVDSLREKIAASQNGSTALADELLIGQAVALNVLFNECMRLAAMNMGEYPAATERYMRLGLKAQSQCRATFESLGRIKNPPNVAFVRQANIAHGPQQVNNGANDPQAVPASVRAGENGSAPIELLENSDGEWMDARAASSAGRGDPAMATVGQVNWAEDGQGQGGGER